MDERLDELREHRERRDELAEARKQAHAKRTKVTDRRPYFKRTDHWRPRRFKSQQENEHGTPSR